MKKIKKKKDAKIDAVLKTVGALIAKQDEMDITLEGIERMVSTLNNTLAEPHP